MRLKALLLGDIRFQLKYGFYLIYLIFTILYIGVLFAFPSSWRKEAAILMIFTDPAAMGLFFMGAIVLFEKSEKVLDSIAVSPVKTWEYVLSKLLSIGVIATAVGLAIGIPAGVVTKPAAFIAGVFVCSCLFSAAGLIIACRITTLNQFLLAIVPVEILICVPAVIWLFWYQKSWMLLHPGVCMIVLCSGGGGAPAAFASLLLWTALFTAAACAAAGRMLKFVGGVKL